MKKKLLVSFSGGETSAYMAQWLWNNKQDEYEMIFVFASTGEENEETLEFIQNCEDHFGFPVVWVEAITNPTNGKGVTVRKVNFKSASRNGEPFEPMIAKHGIPNPTTPHCTRELKQRPIEKYAKSIGWKNYYTAIGIRNDEADRMNKSWKKLRLVYPLITMIPTSKPKINYWWSQQPFRLELKGWQGNCKWCWKKALVKHYKIAQETPECFDFPDRMEKKYEQYVPKTRLKKLADRGEKPILPVRFFRENRSVSDITREAKSFNGIVPDDSENYNYQLDLIGGESCEVFSECHNT